MCHCLLIQSVFRLKKRILSSKKILTSFYSYEELEEIGFKYVGKDVKISRYARIYTPEVISIGDCSRIDDFAILPGVKLAEGVVIGHFSLVTRSCRKP